MRPKQYDIKLSAKDRQRLNEIISKGTEKSRKITRCRILLLSAQNHSQATIAEMLSVTSHTVRNVCLRYIEEGLEAAISEKPRSGAPGIFDGKQKAKLTALACSKAPDGYSQWSLRLLADKAVELKIVDSISHTDVGRILKKMKSART
jgi:transposase